MGNLLLGITLTTGGALTPIAPERANDDSLATGSTYTPAGVYSGGEAGHWIADLGTSAALTGVEAYMAEGAPNYSVWTSDDGSAWTERVDNGADWSVVGGAGTLYEAAMAVTARYVRLTWIAGGGYDGGAYLLEWRVFGEYTAPVDPNPDPEPYEPAEPGGPILEIYTADPDGDRWGIALWGTGTWADAGWQDITPEGVIVDVSRGTDDPSSGILAKPAAGVWTVLTYDPDRVLDPANDASPFVGYLVPGTPIRLNHRTRTLRTGAIESITYSEADQTGRIRAAGVIARLQAKVPDDATLTDTLWARARDAIAAAGIADADVAAGRPSEDAPLSDKPVGELTAWEHVRRAALEVLMIPYEREDGRLGFQPYSPPLERGRVLSAPELVDLVRVVDDRGLYSVVRALDDDGVTVTERAFTPTPRYGRRVYERTDTTIDSEAWAAEVLADRAEPAVRYVPGEIYPLTADAVEYFAGLRIGEIVAINTPDVETAGRILGDRIRAQYRQGGGAPSWRFQFHVAPAPATVLVADFTYDPLVADQDADEYLTPG